MEGKSLFAKNVEEVVYVNTINSNLNAKNVKEVHSVNIILDGAHAENVEEVVSVNTIIDGIDAKNVEDVVYVNIIVDGIDAKNVEEVVYVNIIVYGLNAKNVVEKESAPPILLRISRTRMQRMYIIPQLSDRFLLKKKGSHTYHEYVFPIYIKNAKNLIRFLCYRQIWRFLYF